MASTLIVDFTCSLRRERVYRCRWKRRLEHLRYLRDKNLRRNYGITLEQYEDLLKEQNGVCAICLRRSQIKRQRNLDVDHDKETGQVRGLLCNHCNRGIAFLRHDTKLLQASIEYLFSCAVELT